MDNSNEWLGFAGMALSVLAYLPQVIHLIRERCSGGLSPGAYCMWGIAASLLLIYAIAKRDPVFVSLQSYHVGASGLLFYYCLRYRGQPCGLRDRGQLREESGGYCAESRAQGAGLYEDPVTRWVTTQNIEVATTTVHAYHKSSCNQAAHCVQQQFRDGTGPSLGKMAGQPNRPQPRRLSRPFFFLRRGALSRKSAY